MKELTKIERELLAKNMMIDALENKLKQAANMLSNVLEMDVNPDNISNLYEYISTHCQVCGSKTDRDYLQRYGMCCGCYAYDVCADGVPCTKPNPLEVDKGMRRSLEG